MRIISRTSVEQYRNTSKTIPQIARDSQVRNCYLYMLTLLKNDPFFESMKTEPEFGKIISVMESKYAKVHNDVGRWLEKQQDF